MRRIERLFTTLPLVSLLAIGMAMPAWSQSTYTAESKIAATEPLSVASPPPSDLQTRQIEVIALDADAGRAVLLVQDGQTVTLDLGAESTDGLRLTAVSTAMAMIEVRDPAAGETVAYRIGLGETVSIRPLPKQSAGGLRVITESPASQAGSKKESSG